MGLGKPVQQRAAQNPVAAADVQQTADLDSGGPHDAQHQIDLVRGERHTATNPLEEFRRQRRIPPDLIRRLFDHESSRFSHLPEFTPRLPACGCWPAAMSKRIARGIPFAFAAT